MNEAELRAEIGRRLDAKADEFMAVLMQRDAVAGIGVDPRCSAVVRTKLDEALMWAKKGLAPDGD